VKGLIATYLLTYGGAALSLFNPFYGLLIYISFAIIKPDLMWHWSVPPGNYSRIVAIALLLGWAFRGFGSLQLGRAKAIVVCFVGFWTWSVVSGFLAATDGQVAFRFAENLAKVLLPFLVGITVIRSIEQLKQLAWVIVLSQGYVALEMNLSYYDGFNRLYMVGFGGMDNNCNAISMVTATGLALFLGVGSERRPNWWETSLALGAALLMSHAVMFSFSRGGLLALIITGVASAMRVARRPKPLLLLAVGFVIAMRLAGPQVVERFMTTFADESARDVSAQSRLDLWADCWDLMRQHPILGVGPDHWPLMAGDFGWPAGKHAHSLWFQTGAELGFPGLAFLVFFYGICMSRTWSLARTKSGPGLDEPWLKDTARMVFAALAGFLVAAQFVSVWGIEIPYYTVLLGAGALKLASVAPGASSGFERRAESLRRVATAAPNTPASTADPPSTAPR